MPSGPMSLKSAPSVARRSRQSLGGVGLSEAAEVDDVRAALTDPLRHRTVIAGLRIEALRTAYELNAKPWSGVGECQCKSMPVQLRLIQDVCPGGAKRFGPIRCGRAL